MNGTVDERRSLNLAWWNLGVSPPTLMATKDKSIELGNAIRFIKKAAIERSIDLWVFCEVSTEDAPSLKAIADDLDLAFVDIFEVDRRVVIDLSFIYEASKLEYISSKNINVTMPDESTLRIGAKVIFRDLVNNDYITCFFSHWPSRLSLSEQDKIKFASSLRASIDSIFFRYGYSSKIILMGDYNSQPYSYSLHDTLYSTKDYNLVKKKPRLLFNPFWKIISDGNKNNIGTYFFKSPKIDRWFVFDQMMFSSSFLRGKGQDSNLMVDLESFCCHPITDNEGVILDKPFHNSFDHSPIFGRLHYE